MRSDRLDGEGGFTVWGKLMSARRGIAVSALPIGLAKGVQIIQPVSVDDIVRLGDAILDQSGPALSLRRETCAMAED